MNSLVSKPSTSSGKELRAELEVLIAEFEHENSALPPSEEMIDGWRKRSRSLARRLSDSGISGRNKLLLKLKRFYARVRSLRAARKRYSEQRQPLVLTSDYDPVWCEAPLAGRRQTLAQAIHVNLRSQVPLALPASDLAETDAPLEVLVTHDDPQSRAADTHSMAAVEPTAARTELFEVESLISPKRVDAFSTIPVPRRSTLPGHSVRLDPVMAIEARLARAGTFDRAREIACDWLKEKRFKLPGDSPDEFEIEASGKGNRAMAIGLPTVWAMQAETVDGSVKGRRWRVEMVLIDTDATPAVSVTLTALSPVDAPVPPPSVPRLVQMLIKDIGLLDMEASEALFTGATFVDDHAALQRLLTSLQSSARHRPAVVLSTYEKAGRPATLLDPQGLARRLGGVAKVYVLKREMSWALTDALSKRFAVAGATVRLFRPGFTPDDAPSRHPAWNPAVLTSEGLTLSDLSSLFLQEASHASLRALEREDAIPPFERVREKVLRRQVEEARRQAQPTREGAERSVVEIRALEKALADEGSLRELYEKDNDQLRGDLTKAREDRDSLSGRVVYLENRVKGLLKKFHAADAYRPPEFPNNWDELEDWCSQHLSDIVVVTSKAIRAARDSGYIGISFAYEVLWFLADVFAPSKLGSLAAGAERLQAEMERLEIEIEPVGRAAAEWRSKETYSTNYKHERVSLDMHVKGSSSRDPRYGFRVYFHWHENDGCVVVGWLPSHLDNSLT